MTLRTLILRNLRFHARANLGVLLGAVVGSAVLVGALVVGDSVKESLRELALSRLGSIRFAMSPGDRLFRSQLAEEFYAQYTRFYSGLYDGAFAAALQLPATAGNRDASARASRVNLIGVDARWLKMGGDARFTNIPPDGVLLNEALAKHLRATIGDTILFRIPKTTSSSLETPIAPRSDQTTALRAEIIDIVPPVDLGDLSLIGSQGSPFNAFVALRTLQELSTATNKANLLVSSKWEVDLPQPLSRFEQAARVLKLPKKYINVETATSSYEAMIHRVPLPLDMLNAAQDMQRIWTLADVELNLRTIPLSTDIELSSPRVFLDLAVDNAVRANPERAGKETARRLALGQDDKATEIALAEMLCTDRKGILTYFVNRCFTGTNTTPYSMVTAAGPPWTPADMHDNEIAVNQWLADDLQVKPGDEISLTYFDPDSGARLVERTNTFRVRSVVPMEMPWADRTLMPEFPGIEKAESTHDWDAGFPLVHKIRQQDEDYWKQYRGTPKAFVTLAAGQKMWGNRFGDLTAIRFPTPTNTSMLAEQSAQGRAGSPLPAAGTSTVDGAHGVTRPTMTAEEYRAALERKILATLKPEELGLRFEPVREQALKAAEQSQDFGQLFLGFSFFLIVAALLLMSLLFQLGLEQRTAEVGTLLALGFPPRQVRRLLLLEGCALALIGGVIGALVGTVYAKAILQGLTTIWRDAVGTSALHYHANATTLVIGVLASTFIAAVTIWLTLRKQGQRPARELLEEGAGEKFQTGRSRAGLIGAIATVSAAALVAWAIAKGETGAAEIFFSAGALLLIGGLGFCAAWFAHLARRAASTSRLTIGSLGLRGCSRRRKRSLATVALLACGTFLIAAIGVFRLDANLDATKRSSGTGGFALFGESTLPVVQDLNTKSGRDFFALDADKLAGVEFVPFRVRDGDDASCLNLNRAQKPRLLGVKPETLEGRFTFAKAARDIKDSKSWLSLKHQYWFKDPEIPLLLDSVPAIGDANSIQWALGKKVGDTLDYVDERGQPFKVRIVGAIANSILQGSLIIDEAEFIKRFPSESGYRMFLIDSPTNRTAEISATLSRALEDVGLELQPTAQKLAAFNAVQNTYLSTFQILGGLGLLLGSAGLGVVVLRNVLERRGELALLLAVGFRARSLRWLVLSEHGALLWLGLGVGVIAAIVAVLPSLLSPGAEIPYLSLALTLAAVLVNGMIWTWLAARFALRGKLLNALRNE